MVECLGKKSVRFDKTRVYRIHRIAEPSEKRNIWYNIAEYKAMKATTVSLAKKFGDGDLIEDENETFRGIAYHTLKDKINREINRRIAKTAVMKEQKRQQEVKARLIKGNYKDSESKRYIQGSDPYKIQNAYQLNGAIKCQEIANTRGLQCFYNNFVTQVVIANSYNDSDDGEESDKIDPNCNSFNFIDSALVSSFTDESVRRSPYCFQVMWNVLLPCERLISSPMYYLGCPI